jgi:hypothetical protein
VSKEGNIACHNTGIGMGLVINITLLFLFVADPPVLFALYFWAPAPFIFGIGIMNNLSKPTGQNITKGYILAQIILSPLPMLMGVDVFSALKFSALSICVICGSSIIRTFFSWLLSPSIKFQI